MPRPKGTYYKIRTYPSGKKVRMAISPSGRVLESTPVISKVKQKLESLKNGLPKGVEIVETYDRSALINRAVDTLVDKLIEEFIVVALVCAVFLFHFRSSLVVILSLPMGILAAFIIMYQQGINANIMSLGGIAIAIGAMVDAAIVMIENVHKHIEREGLSEENRWSLMTKAAIEVGPALFFSLLIITLSFLPVFALEGTHVCTTGVYKNICHGSGSRFIHYTGACVDGLLYSWSHHARA